MGVSAIVVREGRILLGCRRNAHGAGSWAFPGGRVEIGEDPGDAAVRELREETGLEAVRVTPLRWTSDVFSAEGLHYITLHHLVEATGDPMLVEPDKCEGWFWHRYEELPTPLFGSAASLFGGGWRP